MSPRSSILSSTVDRILSFGGLALVMLLFATMLAARGTTKPDQKESLNTAPSPVRTSLPTERTPTSPATTVTVGQTTPSAVRTVETLERDYGVWGYKVGRDVNNPAITRGNVHYDFDTVAELNAFAAANRELALDLVSRGGQVEVYVTFRTYLTPEQFRAWVTSRGATVSRSELRTEDQNSQEGTLWQGAIPGDTEPLPQDRLDSALQKYSATLRGVYSTIITVDATRLPEITTDPLVFIANVTPNVARNELHAVGWQTQPNSLYVDPPSPFWKMEQLGLENFTR
jgi:hypothetical protein